jgi:hypothetical protein
VLGLVGACSFTHGALDPTRDATPSTDSADAASDAPPGTVTHVEVDNVSSTVGSYELAKIVSHTVAPGDGRLLLVALSTDYAGTHATMVRYGTTALTFVGAIDANSDDGRVELWHLVAPPVGTANVIVTVDNQSSQYIIGVASLIGVNQSAPLGPFTSGKANTGNPALAVPSGADQLVLAVLMWNGSYETLLPGSGQDQRWYSTGNDVIGTGSFKAGEPSTSFGWSASSPLDEYWAAAGVAIRPQ